MTLEEQLKEAGYYKKMEMLDKLRAELDLYKMAGGEAYPAYHEAERRLEHYEDSLDAVYETTVAAVDSQNDLDLAIEMLVETLLQHFEQAKKHDREAARKLAEACDIEATRKIFRLYMGMEFDEWIERDDSQPVVAEGDK